MNEAPTPRRRRRRRINDEDTSVSVAAPSTELSRSDSIKPLPNEVSVELEANTSSATSKLAAIDRIRTELLEDCYHSQLVDPEYWDESHNWSNDGELISSDYWHFLGRYE